ncbi:hypothetical protein GCM10027578_30090 [Spirosoma luteolum]
MNKLKLPSIKGKIGDWVFFNATMKVKDVANKNRIATVAEVAELYPKNISDVLQRELDSKRISKISEYLRSQKDRFLSTMIVAIYKGSPEWSEIRIENSFTINDEQLSADESLYLDGRLGILSLQGDESVFVLDGQHRLKGIREAYSLSPEVIGNDDISLTFIVHDSTLKERTRRLFTVLNRYAEKPKKAELIIMEEDDAAAIITRRLVLEYNLFQTASALSKTREFAMPSSDQSSFTTLVCLYEITRVLINYNNIYPKKKPIYRLKNDEMDELYSERVLPFWNFFFDSFPEIEKYIEGKKQNGIDRNKKDGGYLLLRPEAQLLLSEVYKHFLEKGQSSFETFKSKLLKIEFNLNKDTWKYIFWTGSKMNTGSKKLKREVFMYLLGEKVDVARMNENLIKLYKDYGSEYTGHLEPIKFD